LLDVRRSGIDRHSNRPRQGIGLLTTMNGAGSKTKFSIFFHEYFFGSFINLVILNEVKSLP
jgi:hypothetical protein